jgi:hypothetical protein
MIRRTPRRLNRGSEIDETGGRFPRLAALCPTKEQNMNVLQFTLDRASAGAKLYVYLTGTTTNAAYYTNADGTSSGTNPQTAAGNGLFAPVYLDPSITYRVKVTNSAGSTTLYDIDPVRVLDEGTADGVLVVRSVDAAKKRTISATVSSVLCAGYVNKGDRGQALYARVASQPAHDGKFQSADGAWWELSENLLNPFMFGAKGDDNGTSGTDDSAAIQAMFDFIETKGTPYPVNFMGARYYVSTGLILPRVVPFVAIDINGGGATLRTDQAITILSNSVPANQAAADIAIGQSTYEIHNLIFQGDTDNVPGQIGLHLIANYGSVVRSCHFVHLDYGSIGTFGLAAAWRDNLYFWCSVRSAVIQSGVGYDSGPVWSNATEPGSASNVNVFENCRVAGHPSNISAFGIFASDACRIEGCISEGATSNYDVHFDYQASPTVKQFHVFNFHAEAPYSKLNFKVRASGKVVIDSLIRSYPAAIYDAEGSNDCEVMIRGMAYLGNLPTVTGVGTNPNGRWFYHSAGNGYGAGTEGNNSSGVGFRFEDCATNGHLYFGDPANWEGATLPQMVHVRNLTAANNGVLEWSNAPISFATPVYLADGGNISGMMTGNVTSATTSVPANSSVTETFSATGLRLYKHTVYVNPYNSAYVPPNGIAWMAWLESDDAFKIRFTNTTGSAITLATNAVWRFCAPRSY